MPKFVKKTYTKRVRNKRKKKGKMDPMAIRGVSSDLSVIVPSESDDFIISNVLTPTVYVRDFMISDMLNFSNYAMWDQYRINWVQVKCVPVGVNLITSDADVSGSVETTPNIVFYIDRDDISVGGVTYDGLRVRAGATIVKATKKWSRQFRPNVLNNVYNGIIATDAYQVPKDPVWLDSGNISCPHFGFKAVMEPGGQVNENFQYKVQVKYCISFANRRT